jgi:hypothetical protein
MEANPELAGRVDPGENALLLCPSFEAAKPTACGNLLTPEEPTDENVLWIAYTPSPSNCWTSWHRHADATPADAVVLDVDGGSQPITTEINDEFTGDAALTIDRVSSPTDLTTIGTRLTEQLADWADETPGRRSVLCLDSVTALLQYTTGDQTVRFLDAVTEKVAAYDAVGHYHIDPGAVDDQITQRLATVFDHCWQFEDGEWDVLDTGSRPHLA